MLLTLYIDFSKVLITNSCITIVVISTTFMHIKARKDGQTIQFHNYFSIMLKRIKSRFDLASSF